MKTLLPARILLLAILLAMPLAWGQSTAGKAETFPQNLLEGRADFTVALQFQSDARGNVGPCG